MEGKFVVVPGGASGLGSEIVEVLASKGAIVAVVTKGDPNRVAGAKFLRGGIDLTDFRATVGALDEILKAFGRIDALVNVVGTFRWETLANGDITTWDLLYTANLKSTVIACKAVLPHVLQTKGSIVNIGANAALKGGVGMGAYTASKAGVARLTEALAEEVKEKGVRVNAVLPSIIDTPQNRADMPDADFSKWVLPREIAEVVAFLITQAASGITGACIPVVGRV